MTAHGNEHWLALYRVALSETDQGKATPLIEEAEKAALARGRYLLERSGSGLGEQHALKDALYALRALRHSRALGTLDCTAQEGGSP